MADDARKRQRGKGLAVPSLWLEQVLQFKKTSGKTYRQLGADLGVILGRPVAHATVNEYVMGRVVTEELTNAFAQLMGVPPPVTGSNTDLELQEWCDLGRRLKHEASERFREELAALRTAVEALEQYRHRRRGR
jgi:hypothetical protein